jgi:aspartate kinase
MAQVTDTLIRYAQLARQGHEFEPDRLLEDAFSSVTFEHNKTIVCVVGENMRDTPGIAARVFSSIQDVNVNMISQRASEINLTFVVNQTDVPMAVRKFHREFFR